MNENLNVHYSLTNLENYLPTINESASEIVNKYYLLISEYLNFIVENIKCKNLNIVYTKFIIKRGIETITNVFNILLYYSRNLNIAYYHSQKAFYFYVEFIGQISEDKHTFLQLSSRDASVFVYKKTIFEMNNDIRKNISELQKNDIVKLDILNAYILIIQKLINIILEKDYNYLKHNNVYSNNFEITNNLMSDKENFVIDIFINNFINIKNNISFNKYFEIIKAFINKFLKLKPDVKNKFTESYFFSKFSDPLIENKLDDSCTNFIKWLFIQ